MRNLIRRNAAIYTYRIPLNPSISCAGRQLSDRHGLVLRLSQGAPELSGLGESAPLPGFSNETLAQCQQALIRLVESWVNQPVDNFAGDSKQLQELLNESSPSACFGFSCALHELTQGPLFDPTPVPSYPLLQSPSDAALLQQTYRGQDQAALDRPRSIKLKLARQPLDQEIAWVQSLLTKSPLLRLRIDCNQGWTLQQAKQFLSRIPLETLQAIEYLEEPCHDLQQSLRLADQYAVPLALDESLRQPGFILPEHPALAALIIKPSLTGSLQQLDSWVSLGRARRLRVILSSSYESSLGLSQISALASQYTPDEPPGLDTASHFRVNLLRGGNPLKPTLGWQDLTRVWHS